MEEGGKRRKERRNAIHSLSPTFVRLTYPFPRMVVICASSSAGGVMTIDGGAGLLVVATAEEARRPRRGRLELRLTTAAGPPELGAALHVASVPSRPIDLAAAAASGPPPLLDTLSLWHCRRCCRSSSSRLLQPPRSGGAEVRRALMRSAQLRRRRCCRLGSRLGDDDDGSAGNEAGRKESPAEKRLDGSMSSARSLARLPDSIGVPVAAIFSLLYSEDNNSATSGERHVMQREWAVISVHCHLHTIPLMTAGPAAAASCSSAVASPEKVFCLGRCDLPLRSGAAVISVGVSNEGTGREVGLFAAGPPLLLLATPPVPLLAPAAAEESLKAGGRRNETIVVRIASCRHSFAPTRHADSPLRVFPRQSLEGEVLGRKQRRQDLAPDCPVHQTVDERMRGETAQQ